MQETGEREGRAALGAVGRLVVLSDTHFGHEGAVLSRGNMVEAFLGELSGLDGVDALVLLGEVWDLWWAGLPEASRAGERMGETTPPPPTW